MRAYFIYTTPTEERYRAAAIGDLLDVNADGRSMKELVRVLAMEDTEVLVLPDDYRAHCGTIEHLKAIALHMGLRVVPLTRYLNECTAKAVTTEATTALASAAAPTTGHAGARA